ncbi:hypothetical protein THRCLA_00875 [Thraustotheca clavata]|uniref:Uncharacterized protein n=1 Tax=Thraustotheca clavata TaxID=74557 RepID=A0A1W0A9X7_9STRA|nr:hypothetical protein THRCLA_00875 [Thraustotheca clavata]
MNRNEFINALAQALRENEKSETQGKNEQEQAHEVYKALQYDFPQVSSENLVFLARNWHCGYQMSAKLFENALELSGKTAGGALVLVQCFFTPFLHEEMLDSFVIEKGKMTRNEEKMIYVLLHTSYAPLSLISMQEWKDFQVTEKCIEIAKKLLHWNCTTQEGMLLQLEWMRYLYLLRDRMLQFPQNCSDILPQMNKFFQDDTNGQIFNQHDILEIVQLLVELTRSKQITESLMSSSAILAIVQALLPKIIAQMDGMNSSTLIFAVAQLLLWCIQRKPIVWIPLLFEKGVLRMFLHYIGMLRDEEEAVKATLRLLVQCMLFNGEFARYLHQVPSMVKWTKNTYFQEKYRVEYALWTLSKLLVSPQEDPMAFYTLVPGFFPANCTTFLQARQALYDAVYATETFVAMKKSSLWTTWAAKDKLGISLSEFVPKLNGLFAYPMKEDATQEEYSKTESTFQLMLFDRLRKAIKQTIDGNSVGKLD